MLEQEFGLALAGGIELRRVIHDVDDVLRDPKRNLVSGPDFFSLRIGVVLFNHHGKCKRSPLPVHLLQGISRGDRMDTVIQKTTELGVARISPVLTEFSVVRLDAARAAKRTQHWMRVAQSTCEQCGRNSVPVIDTPVTLTDVFDAAATLPQQRLVLQPESSACISDISLAQHDTVLLIGPEGGLSATENEQALAAGFQPASIGPRILRTETAAIAAIAILQSRCGDL